MSPSANRKAADIAGDHLPGQETADPRPSQRTPATSTLAYPNVSDRTRRVQSTPFQLPTQITSFSYNEAHQQLFDDSALNYFVDPPHNARLDYGYDRWVRKPDTRGRLDPLLKAIQRLREDSSNAALVPENGVVCWRGIMTKILTAPYEERDGWDLNVMYVNGVLYFEEHLTDAKLNEKNNMQPRQRQQTYYGYAFESYCTSPTPNRPAGWGGDVNTNVQWCSVVRTKLGDTRMVIGGEVDCVRGKYTGRTDTFVELKTSMTIRGAQDEARFEKKLLKFYFQSFLLGVPEIVVGFRTPSGVVTTLQSFKTIELPRLVRGKPGAWDPSVCLAWGTDFLAFLKSLLENEEGDSVWRVKFTPGSGVSAYPLVEEEAINEVVNGEDRIGFLPSWYWDETLKHAARKPPFDSTTAQAPPPSGPTSNSIQPTPMEGSPGNSISTSSTRTISGWQV